MNGVFMLLKIALLVNTKRGKLTKKLVKFASKDIVL